jgi:predicted regulator of Ras-like GTPase activity (Roadblock/LC7/MglB family)
MSNNGDVLVIYEQDLKRTEDVMRTLLIDSQSRCGLLINRDGSLICQQGEVGALDTAALAALSAAGFAATKEIARQLGEPEFSVLFHQGEHEHMYVSLIDDDALMMLIFDQRTTIGLVRILAKDAAAKLASIFAMSQHRE